MTDRLNAAQITTYLKINIDVGKSSPILAGSTLSIPEKAILTPAMRVAKKTFP